MNIIAFDYSARFGHFLRAEASSSGITYPVPPRTVLLGLVGATLGMEKDEPQALLADAELAIGGPVPRRFWHRTNVRKDPPKALPLVFKRPTGKAAKSEVLEKPEKNFRLPQEWLWQPSYRVWASLPAPYGETFADRLKHRRWYYSPCMGLSELIAELSYVGRFEDTPATLGTHAVHSVTRHDAGTVDVAEACRLGLAIQNLRMPRTVSPDRIFTHAGYLVEREGRPIPISTEQAWRVGEEVVIFL